jgi:hypothetical protein
LRLSIKLGCVNRQRHKFPRGRIDVTPLEKTRPRRRNPGLAGLSQGEDAAGDMKKLGYDHNPRQVPRAHHRSRMVRRGARVGAVGIG